MLNLSSERTLVMGVLNRTPDSFSDGGRFNHLDSALQRVDMMLAEGVDIIDIGGESTRPGAEAVSVEVELERVIPFIDAIRQHHAIPISVDTSKAMVMQAAIKAGADMVNDVRALQEPDALAVCAASTVKLCLMHMQGQPRTMQHNPQYTDVVAEVKAFFEERIAACVAAGISKDRLVLDPGFGFGKNLNHNLTLLRHLDCLVQMNFPILVGMSRKSMIGQLLDNRPVDGRLHGSVAAAVIAAMQGAAIVRVHDVAATVDALKLVEAVR
ncbi:MAG: dihydropteroate synthase [Proteobacteria bacterium]|nr:MAG: dihydropteroate synthase [Pseudomonadota bacterium]